MSHPSFLNFFNFSLSVPYVSVALSSGVLALIIWVGGGALFYVFEKENPATMENFSNIPDALYMTSIFLVGEWAACDFTIPGKVLCCFFCVVGIALYSIPIGFLFEAFQDVLGGDDDDDDEDEEGEENEEKQGLLDDGGVDMESGVEMKSRD